MSEQGLWITGFLTEEMERDVEAWQRAERVVGGLVDAFKLAPDDIPFLVLLDAQVRTRKHIRRLREDGGKPEEQTKAPDVLAAVNGLLSKASDLLMESHAPTEEEREVEREILQYIAKAGKTLAREQQRQREG